jgi:hypothetical protein
MLEDVASPFVVVSFGGLVIYLAAPEIRRRNEK